MKIKFTHEKGTTIVDTNEIIYITLDKNIIYIKYKTILDTSDYVFNTPVIAKNLFDEIEKILQPTKLD